MINYIGKTSIGKEYITYIDKIVNNYDSNNGYYEGGSKKKYIYLKNHVTAYEMTSKYFVKLYNIEVDRKKSRIDYDKTYREDSLKIINAQILKNREEIAKLDLKETKLKIQQKEEANGANGEKINELREKYTPIFKAIHKEKHALINYDYSPLIPKRNRVNDAELKKQRDILRENFEKEWVSLFTNLDIKIYESQILK